MIYSLSYIPFYGHFESLELHKGIDKEISKICSANGIRMSWGTLSWERSSEKIQQKVVGLADVLKRKMELLYVDIVRNLIACAVLTLFYTASTITTVLALFSLGLAVKNGVEYYMYCHRADQIQSIIKLV